VSERPATPHWSIGKLDAGLQVFSDFNDLVPTILDVSKRDALMARKLLKRYPRIKPSDAIHAAVMGNNGINNIISTDVDFDIVKEVKRIDSIAM
jgi:predicted nucleic acid-binding protein